MKKCQHIFWKFSHRKVDENWKFQNFDFLRKNRNFEIFDFHRLFDRFFFWIPLVLGFFQWISHSTPSNSVLRQLLQSGVCLGTPSVLSPSPQRSLRPVSFWLTRNSQFRDLSKPVIRCPGAVTTLPVTGDVTLDNGYRWRHVTRSFRMTS